MTSTGNHPRKQNQQLLLVTLTTTQPISTVNGLNMYSSTKICTSTHLSKWCHADGVALHMGHNFRGSKDKRFEFEHLLFNYLWPHEYRITEERKVHYFHSLFETWCHSLLANTVPFSSNYPYRYLRQISSRILPKWIQRILKSQMWLTHLWPIQKKLRNCRKHWWRQRKLSSVTEVLKVWKYAFLANFLSSFSTNSQQLESRRPALNRSTPPNSDDSSNSSTNQNQHLNKLLVMCQATHSRDDGTATLYKTRWEAKIQR